MAAFDSGRGGHSAFQARSGAVAWSGRDLSARAGPHALDDAPLRCGVRREHAGLQESPAVTGEELADADEGVRDQEQRGAGEQLLAPTVGFRK